MHLYKGTTSMSFNFPYCEIQISYFDMNEMQILESRIGIWHYLSEVTEMPF